MSFLSPGWHTMQPMQAVASASRAVEFATQWQGQVVDGRYPLDQYLGGSDSQAVFLTRMPGNSGRAAIKLVRASACDPEAQLATWHRVAKLSHPHLIRIFDCGRCWLAGHDLVFVITEFAEENLGQVFPLRALSTAETESMLRPIVDALAYLHAQGLVHGHIRPSNVMAINEQVKLSSDGIQASGSPLRVMEESAYDAPELAVRRLAPASDIWSVGKLVTEALTQTMASRTEHVRLPQPFADIVKHCLVKEPALRWTIREVSDKLQPGEARSRSRAIVSPRSTPMKSSRPIWMAIALVAIAVVLMIVFTHRGSRQIQPSQQISTTSVAVPPATPPASIVQDSRGSAVRRSLPNPSPSALNTIHGRIKIRVKVAVDATGRVTEASFINRGPSQYFARLALQAAQEWKFAPGTSNGQPASREWNILFEYTRHGVEASEQSARGR